MLRMFCFMTKHTLLGLGAFSCHGRMLPAASARSVSLNVARFEICPENRNRATKFVVSFRGFLSLGRFLRHGVRCKLGVWTVRREAQWRAQGLPIAIVEEIAFENGWITRDELMESADRYGKGPYCRHLKGIADGEIMLVPNQKN